MPSLKVYKCRKLKSCIGVFVGHNMTQFLQLSHRTLWMQESQIIWGEIIWVSHISINQFIKPLKWYKCITSFLVSFCFVVFIYLFIFNSDSISRRATEAAILLIYVYVCKYTVCIYILVCIFCQVMNQAIFACLLRKLAYRVITESKFPLDSEYIS